MLQQVSSSRHSPGAGRRPLLTRPGARTNRPARPSVHFPRCSLRRVILTLIPELLQRAPSRGSGMPERHLLAASGRSWRSAGQTPAAHHGQPPGQGARPASTWAFVNVPLGPPGNTSPGNQHTPHAGPSFPSCGLSPGGCSSRGRPPAVGTATSCCRGLRAGGPHGCPLSWPRG